jgi:hypothetical protein
VTSRVTSFWLCCASRRVEILLAISPLLLLLQWSFYSVAVVLLPVQTKQIRIQIDINETIQKPIQTIQNTVNTSTNVTRTPTHYKTHIYLHPHIRNNLKQPQYKIHTKWNSHTKNKYPRCKVTPMNMVFCPQKLHHKSLHFTSLHFASLQNKDTSHKSISSLHITTLHITSPIYIHSHMNSLACNYITKFV